MDDSLEAQRIGLTVDRREVVIYDQLKVFLIKNLLNGAMFVSWISGLDILIWED